MVFIQTGTAKYALGLCLALGLSLAASGQQAPGNAYITKADTLFRKKQFTQSFELYEQLFAQGKYSPAMLLRMAYIQEGSGHVSRTLYYLSLYYKATGDDRVLAKIDELAVDNKLEGYTISPADRFFSFLDHHFLIIAAGLTAVVCLLMGFTVFEKRRRRPVGLPAAAACLVMGVLFLHVNFAEPTQHGITADPSTYIMAGPSAGAGVVAIVADGHQLKITGKQDVWVRVQWQENEAWVRGNSLLRGEL